MNHFEKIAAALKDRGLDAMLITSEPGEFYAVGFHGEGVALVTPGKTWYYTDPRYIEAAQQLIPGAEVSLPPKGQGYQKTVAQLVKDCGVSKLGFEEEYMSVASHTAWTKEVEAEFVPASQLLTELRMVKDADELAVMKEAQRITDEALLEILNFLKPGLTEQEVAARLTYIMARKGAERNSFDPIVACGANGSKPHAVPGPDVIQKGQFVTMDFGCKVGGYCSDMTRTVAVGKPTEEMELVYDTVLRAQLAGIAAAKAGVTGKEVHEAGAKVIADAGYGDYFTHGFGHSLGIEIHENPGFHTRNDKPIPAGALLSAEPGIYLPGKFGVRIEDVVMLTEGGCIDITHSPKQLIIL
ncbi:MAG: Xaa-Pro peptidase family protein [Oscillospiraceae bacterium]|nr:Xaa-Pro peptidase family protein [Oscillospiraceae bacterium]